jgi:rsbT co-antagonist protein RsbR
MGIFVPFRYTGFTGAQVNMGTSAQHSDTILAAILREQEADILAKWLQHQLAATTLRTDLLAVADLRTQSQRFLATFTHAVQRGDVSGIQGSEWEGVREILSEISTTRAQKGFSSGETATFILSLKQPLFESVREQMQNDPAALASEFWNITALLDKLALFTIETFQKTRESVIKSQQEEMLELSTPVVQLFDGILALPLIGTLDSARTQVVMENLLNSIVSTGSNIAILDITGVPTVDTLVAQHLLKTVAAARLMGADCIISGIRPQIAQTIVHLGVELQNVITKANIADALVVALGRIGYRVTRTDPQAAKQ